MRAMSDVITGPPGALPEPTQDERTFATLSHALLIVGGWIPALIIFFVKSESKFVRFHALQAVLLSAIHVVTLVVFWFVCFFVFFASMFHLATMPQQQQQMAFPWGFFLLIPFIWLFAIFWWVVMLLVAIIFSIKAGRGQWDQIPITGRWAKRILKIA